jgi:hypothetical protein
MWAALGGAWIFCFAVFLQIPGAFICWVLAICANLFCGYKAIAKARKGLK